MTKRVHLHMVSDATGETVDTITRACLARFPDMQPVEHLYALVTDQEMLEEACAGLPPIPDLFFIRWRRIRCGGSFKPFATRRRLPPFLR